MATNESSNTTYVATAKFCNAGMEVGVTMTSLFLAYAKNETAIAKNPTSMRARYENVTVLCFSTL